MKFTTMNKIINFHHITDSAWLDNMITYLKTKYKFISVEEIYEYYQGTLDLRNTCHITIDDGDKSFYKYIFPVLKKHNVSASLYVSPKIIKERSNYWFQEIRGYNQIELRRIISDMSGISSQYLEKKHIESILKSFKISQIHEIINRYRKITRTSKKGFQNMTIDNLKEVNQSGLVTIGAHTLNHPILKNEDDISSRYEIEESIQELSTILNQKIEYFAFPNGIPELDFSEREINYLRELEIHLTFTTESRNFSIADDMLSIPRIGVSDAEGMLLFKSKMLLGSLWNPLVKLKPNGEFKERKKLIKSFSTK